MNVSAMDSKRPGSALIGRYLAHKEHGVTKGPHAPTADPAPPSCEPSPTTLAYSP